MNRFDLSDKVAIVTGGGQGLGRGIVQILAANGAAVVVADLNLEKAEQVTRGVVAMGGKSIAARTDVRTSSQVRRMTKTTLRTFGKIDILVNNAGIDTARGPIVNVGEIAYNYTMDVNIKGVFLCCREIAPAMIKRKKGRIVNIASIAGKAPRANTAIYSASKSAVISFTIALAKQLAHEGITVNAVCPGLVRTRLWGQLVARSLSKDAEFRGLSGEEILERYAKSHIPLGRPQTTEDIGNLVAFLVSDLAGNITGQAINVDGGEDAHI